MLGILGILILNAKRLSDYVKENLGFTVYLNDDVKEADANYLRKLLDASPYVRSTDYISKDRAALELKEELGEDFISFLGYNPLSAAIDVKLKADYANQDSVAKIKKKLADYKQVKEVNYQESLIDQVNKNVSKISLIILIFSALMLFIALVLINNTIRLSVYSKRFIINTMKLVGATWGFIRQPFLLRSMLHGLYAGFIAILLLVGLVYKINEEFGDIINVADSQSLAIIFSLVALTGVIINLISTFFAVNKFLRLRSDDLYY